MINNQLFAYFEYTDDDYATDRERMAVDSKMREWWEIMEPVQEPHEDRQTGEWWSMMEEVFYTD